MFRICIALVTVLVLSVASAAHADSGEFDPDPAWPLCGRIAENPPAGWDPADGCPSDRWGNPDYSDFPLSSTFGPRQLVSEDYRYDFHRGIDIETPVGTPVFAIADGVVRKAGHDSSYSDPLVQIRHYRPGYWGKCKSGGGCYHSNSMHLSDWVVSVGDTVSKGQLIGYTGESASGFDHLHFEIRNAVPGDEYSAWQRDAIHPLQVLPYDDVGSTGTTVSIDEVSHSTNPEFLQVQTTVTMGPDELDLQRVRVYVYEIQPDNSLVLIDQPGDTVDDKGYNVFPAWYDVNVWNRQYTHKDSSKYPWEDFGVGGPLECPYAFEHPSSYDPHIHMDRQDPADSHKGLFNGIQVAPDHFNASSSTYSITLTFYELAGPSDPSRMCIVVEAADVLGSLATDQYSCP
ncbi:MAG: M23 family metallopeptidase [Anaerolineae bacterium]